jgi:hypoxanthine phosphoribosyltransferase
VDFPAEAELNATHGQNKYMYWPEFIQFPAQDIIHDRKILIVDDVWGSGRTITAVKNRVSGFGGDPYTCVLHFNPYRNLFGKHRPDFYAATTDAYIIYPWEAQRGMKQAFFG